MSLMGGKLKLGYDPDVHFAFAATAQFVQSGPWHFRLGLNR